MKGTAATTGRFLFLPTYPGIRMCTSYCECSYGVTPMNGDPFAWELTWMLRR